MKRVWPILLLGIFRMALANTPQSGLRFEHLTVSQGLSNHIIYAMLQDNRGYLWFATQNGLNRYDGYTITSYRKTPGDTSSLTGNAISCLLQDNAGNIWAGMMGQGLCKFDPRTERFTCYGSNPPTMNQGAIRAMAEDREGYLWVSNGRAELRRFDPRTGRYATPNFAALLTTIPAKNHPKPPVIYAIYRDRVGTVWVGSENGLHRLHSRPEPTTTWAAPYFTTYQPNTPNANQVWDIYEDHTGELWVITNNGLHRFDKSIHTFIPHACTLSANPAINNQLRYLAEDHQGNLWMGTENDGLLRFDPRLVQFTNIRHDPLDAGGLSSNHIRSLLVDRSGLLWVGTFGDGVDRANPRGQPFRHYRPLPNDSQSLSKKFVSTLLEDRAGVIWVGTGNGLDRLNKQTGTFTHFRHDPHNPQSLPTPQVHGLLEDHTGTLWVASNGELARFDPKKGHFTTLTFDTQRYPGLANNGRIFTLYEDRQGLIWLGTSNGIKSFDPKTRNTVVYPFDPQNPHGISDAWALSIVEDSRGNLWVGTGSVALNRLDRRSGRFTHYRPDRHTPGSITADAVSGIHQDSKGNLWFATSGGGLCRFNYNTETFQAFTQADGLADNTVSSILEDKQGCLWLGTAKGLSRFSPTRRTFTNYDGNDGLQSNGFGPAHCKGSDGTFYFGGDNGFTAFNPEQLVVNKHRPLVAIVQVKLFDKPLVGAAMQTKLHLQYDENFLSFEFAALEFTNSPANQYAYRLVGLEANWVYSQSRRYVSYSNLEPGTYVFRVKGSNNNGVWNETGASLQVIIHPPWWQTIWFRLLASLSLLFLAGISIRLYTQTKLRRQRETISRIIQTGETERQRLAADLHDDLGGTLATIRQRLSDIRQRLRDPEAAREIDNLEPLIQKSGQDLRRIAHNLMPPEFERIGLRSALQQFVESQPAEPTRFSFLMAGTERKLPLDTELSIYRIVSELVQNIHKHAQAKRAAVQLLYYDDYLSLTVEDDGLGCRVAKTGDKKEGIGLRNSSLRAEYIGAKLEREASEGGTFVMLDVPYSTTSLPFPNP